MVEAGQDQTVFAGDAISFSGSFTDEGIEDTHTIIWDYDDGTSEEGNLNPTHVFPTAGTYPVKLTITDDDGGIGSDTLIVEVSPFPATVTLKPESLNIDSNGKFTAQIQLPDNYDCSKIAQDTLVCSGSPAIKGDISDENPIIYVAHFNRENLVGISPGEDIELTITGEVACGTYLVDFEGTDTITVLNTKVQKEEKTKNSNK